jgi:hypothetical protein
MDWSDFVMGASSDSPAGRCIAAPMGAQRIFAGMLRPFAPFCG